MRPAPRWRSLGLLVAMVVASFILLVWTGNSPWVTVLMVLLGVPLGVTAALVFDAAPARSRIRLPVWFWPEALPWAPVFRRQLWPPALFGCVLAGLLWFAADATGHPNAEANNAWGFAAMATLLVAQLVYLWACSRAFRDDQPLTAGRAREMIVQVVKSGIWLLSVLVPFGVSVAIRLHDRNLLLFVVLAGSALLCLGVMCRGLQAWDDHETVRHDVAGFAIQSGVVVLIMWSVFTFDALLRLAEIGEPILMPEILRTLLYAATLLLLPLAWWTLHVISAAR